MEIIFIDITWRDQTEPAWITAPTQVQDILLNIKKKYICKGSVMCRTDKAWQLLLTEQQPRKEKWSKVERKQDGWPTKKTFRSKLA